MDITIITFGQVSRTPSLDKLLASGNHIQSQGKTFIETLFDQFEYEHSDTQDLPVAAITTLADLENTDGKIWMRADPVFLHTDLTSLLLFDSQSFSLTKEEAAGFFSIINPMLEEDGLCLICGDDPSRWYLELKNNPPITTTPPGIVNGQDIRPYLPVGKDRAYWIRLANEIQMLLHDCSINEERQQRGEMPINSVWFWGVGQLSDQIDSIFDRIISEDVNAQGLAIQAGIPHEKMPVNFEHYLNMQEKDQNILIALSQDKMAQAGPIFDSLFSSLKKGRVKKLEIIMDDQHRKVKRSHLLRFWRK